MKALLYILFCALATLAATFPSVKIGNNSTINSKAVFEAVSTAKGILIPKMTTAQRVAISGPPQGLLVYDTSLDSTCQRNSLISSWTCLPPMSTSSFPIINNRLLVTSSSAIIQFDSSGTTGQFLVSNGANAIPTWQSVQAITTPSEVYVTTGSGHGSVGTKIRTYSSTVLNTGTDISYTSDATNGDYFTINTPGTYSVTVMDSNGGVQTIGASKNSNQLSTNLASITNTHRLIICGTNAGSVPSTCTVVSNLVAGDKIRMHDEGSADGAADNNSSFRITRVD